jgi:hypothetical protein
MTAPLVVVSEALPGDVVHGSFVASSVDGERVPDFVAHSRSRE